MGYDCEFCGHNFKQKNDLQRHLSKKNGCIPVEKILEKKEQLDTKNGKIQELHSLFKTCLDILRNDAEHLIGDEALNELSHFLILKQSEKHLKSNVIDIYDLNLYKEGILKYGEEKFIEYLEYIKFSKLAEYVKIPEKESNIKKIFDDFLWKEVLSKHPKFKDVFENGKNSFIKESKTLKKIIITIDSIDFDNYEHDVLGEAYESIFVDTIFGAGGNKKSELGQFFTPPKVKNLLVKLVNPTLKENGKIESVLDPASGTGGILNTVIKHFKKIGNDNKISEDELRKHLINNIYGIEIKGKIFNLCLSNMLINTGEILPNVICADSIRKFHNIKVDTIIANPPFSVSIQYDELLTALGSVDILNDYIPVKAGGKNSEVLFLQMMIHCLNIGGRCATVMLDGEKMYGSSSGFDKVREYSMKSCDLHEVISCPAGTFTSTASKTCILFFTKKKERKDVVEITTSKRILNFCKTHATKNVKFYDFNPDTEQKYLIHEVNIDEIASKKYSLSYSTYNAVEEEKEDEEDIKWVELGEVCDFKNGKGIKKENLITGEYPVIGGGQKPLGYHNEYNNNENTILCSSSGAYAGFISKYEKKVWASDCFSIFSKNKDIVNEKYLFYYLKSIQTNIYKLQNGAAQPHVYSKDLMKIKIPIPSIEKQNKIVEFLDKLYENKNVKLNDTASYYENTDIFRILLNDQYELFEKIVEWHEQSFELSKQIDFFKKRQTNYFYFIKNCEKNIKTLGEVCEINLGTRIVKKNTISGEYPVFGSGRETFKTNTYNREGFNVLIGRFALSLECVRIVNHKLFLNDSGLSIKPKNTELLHRYIAYYFFENQHIVYNISRGTAQRNLDMDKFKQLKIPIPSIERQKEIIEYCDNNFNIIKQLENEIEQNKKQANLFISNINIGKESKLNDDIANELNSTEEINNNEDNNIIDNDEDYSDEIDDNNNEDTNNNEIVKEVKKIKIKKL